MDQGRGDEGLERVQVKSVGQDQGPAARRVQPARLPGVARHGAVAENVEGPRLGPTFLVLPGEGECMQGKGVCLRQVTGTQSVTQSSRGLWQ